MGVLGEGAGGGGVYTLSLPEADLHHAKVDAVCQLDIHP